MELDDPDLSDDIVRYVRFEEEHRPFLKDTQAIEEVWRWMPDIPGSASVDHYISHVLAAQKRGDVAAFSLFDKRDDNFAGVAGFGAISKLHRRVQIQFAWHPDRYRATNLYLHVQRWMVLRAKAWGARRIEWHVDPENEAALGAMLGVGAHEDAHFRTAMRMVDGRWANLVIFSVVRDEMDDAAARLLRIAKRF